MKNINPLGFFDEHFLLDRLTKLNDPLVKPEAYIDWRLFLPILDMGPHAVRGAHGGCCTGVCRGVGFRSINDGGIDNHHRLRRDDLQHLRHPRPVRTPTESGKNPSRPESRPSKRKERRTPEDLPKQPESPDGQENEQEPQHQRWGDLLHAEDFKGELLQVLEDRGIKPFAPCSPCVQVLDIMLYFAYIILVSLAVGLFLSSKTVP